MKQQNTSFQIISSCGLKFPSRFSSPDSDLIQGNNCSSFEQENEYSLSDRSCLNNQEDRNRIVKYFVERYGFNEAKLKKVIERLSRKERCGRKGFVGYVKDINTGSIHLEYIPLSCGCESCAYCSRKKRKRIFVQISEKLEYYARKGETIDFLTITCGRVEAGKFLEVYEDFVKKLRKLYVFRLGNKNLRRWKEKSYEELKSYLLNIKDEEERKEKRLMHEYLIEKSFGTIKEAVERGAKKLYEVFKYVFLKIEVTYKEGCFHLHAHGVTVRSLSKFVWMAILRILGFGFIFDIRRVRNVKGMINYLSKYLLKSDEIEFSDLRHEILYEYTLYNRRKVREWGGEDIERREEEKYEEEIVYVLNLKLEMELRKPLYKLRKNEFGLKYIAGEFEYEGKRYFMFVDECGRFVLDEKFFKEIEEDLMLDRYKVLYKFKRRRLRDGEIVEEKVVDDIKLEEEKSFLNINFV